MGNRSRANPSDSHRTVHFIQRSKLQWENKMHRHLALFAAVTACLVVSSCSKAPPAGVAASVNGRPITDAQLEKTYKTQYGQQPENANADLVKSQKLELLGSLITNQIMLLEAEKLGLQAVDADVDAEITKMKAPYTKEEFDKQLAGRNMTLADLKTEVRQKLTVDKLIAKEITSHITITDVRRRQFLLTPTKPASTSPNRRCTWHRSW